MSHVLQAISDAFLSGTSRPFATLERLVRRRTSELLTRLVRPKASSLRVSQRWLDEHEAAEGQRPCD